MTSHDASFGLWLTVSLADVLGDHGLLERIRMEVYRQKLVVLRTGAGADRAALVQLAAYLGQVVPFFDPKFQDADFPGIYLTHDRPDDSARTAKGDRMWHADYQYLADPASITLLAPYSVPEQRQGATFIDMSAALASLPDSLRPRPDTVAVHGMGRFLARTGGAVAGTPPSEVRFPARMRHPVTGSEFLYVSEAFTLHLEGAESPNLRDLLEATGQLDESLTHPNVREVPYEAGDIFVWDNRALVHRSLMATGDRGVASYRITIRDEAPLPG